MHLLQLHFIREQKTAVVHNRLQALLLDATNKNIARGKTAQDITSMTILTSLASIDGIFTISKGHPRPTYIYIYIFHFHPSLSNFIKILSPYVHPLSSIFSPFLNTFTHVHPLISSVIHFCPFSSILIHIHPYHPHSSFMTYFITTMINSNSMSITTSSWSDPSCPSPHPFSSSWSSSTFQLVGRCPHLPGSHQ